MPRPTIWISRQLSEATLSRARRDYEVIFDPSDMPGSAEDIIAMSRRVDGMMVCHSEQFTADVSSRLDPRMKIVANHSVGTDHCDIAALKKRGIVVTNTPGVLADATAEMAFYLLLAAARKGRAADSLVRSGRWDSWSPALLVGKQVTGARLGIVGMGGIGKALARKARGFDMEIHYHNRSRLSQPEEQGAIYHDSLDSLLPISDFLSLNCPATPETIGLMTRERFMQLPEGSVFVNAARGNLVEEDALIEALSSGHLAAAGLDCFETEPGGNPAMAAHDNIVMSPHIASATVATRDAMGFLALDNLDAFFRGETPPNAL